MSVSDVTRAEASAAVYADDDKDRQQKITAIKRIIIYLLAIGAVVASVILAATLIDAPSERRCNPRGAFLDRC